MKWAHLALFPPFWPYLLFGARWECPLTFQKIKKSDQNLANYCHLKVRPIDMELISRNIFIPNSSYYPTYCIGFCYGMTREIIDRLLLQVPKTRYYYIEGVYLTGILRRKAGLKPPLSIRNGPLMCQHLNDLRFLAKRFQIEYTSTTVEGLIHEAHQKKFDLVAQ